MKMINRQGDLEYNERSAVTLTSSCFVNRIPETGKIASVRVILVSV